MLRRLIVALLITGLLGGCSLFGSKDNAEPPAELKKFDRRVELHKLWGHGIGKGTDQQFVRLVPTLADDRVYVADRSGAIAAYELDSGKRMWRNKTGLAISAGAGVGGGLVLAGSSEGRLVALDAVSGEQRWLVDVPSEVLSVPRVYDDIVIVQTVDGTVSALSAKDGKRLWLYDRSVPVLTLRGTSTPLIDAGVVIAGFANGKLAALDVRNGREIWSAAVAIPHGRTELQRIVDLDADPVISGGILYAGSFQGRLVAVSLQDGRILWNREMSTYAGIAVDRSLVLVSDADSDVWALERRSGQSLWKQSDLRRRSLTGPASVGDYVAVGDYEGYLHLLSRSDGAVVGRERVDSDGIGAAPLAIGDDRLLVLGAGGTLSLYQLETR